MTDAPADLTGFTRQVRTACGFNDPNEVGMLPNAAHLRSGGFHCGVQDIRNIGKYPTGDYSTRQTRDRVGGNTSSAVDVGDNWPHGGRAAWLRFNNAVVAELKSANPELAALRGINFSPDGTARKRYDTNNRAQGVIDSTDTVTIHTHLEFWRNTAGTAARAQACAHILQLIGTAINGAPVAPTPESGTAPQGDPDMYFVRCGQTDASHNSRDVFLADGRGHTFHTDQTLLTYLTGKGVPYYDGVASTYFDVLLGWAKDAPATTTVTVTDAQITAIADRLVASNANGLTAADHAGVVADVKKALTEGTA